LNYSEDGLNQLKQKYTGLQSEYSDLAFTVSEFAQSLKSERAREFMLHGVWRRIWIIYQGIVNIFRLFPPERSELLSSDDRIDVEINLHAFLINIYGVIENLALAAAYEGDLIGKESEGKIPILKISLFKTELRRHLNKPLQEYLKLKRINNWYREYAKNYRDALVHRIPPYVPPSALNEDESRRYNAIEKEISDQYLTSEFDRIEVLNNEQERLGKAAPLFVHSFSERAKPLFLHAQLLADFFTIKELVEVFVSTDRKNYHED
jgi:hypothetical protein